MHELEYSLRSFDIADDERVAFSIGLVGNQIADLVRPRLGTPRMADQMQIRQFCLQQHDRHRGYERMFELRRG